MAIPTTQNNLWTDFGGKGFSAKHAEYAERASTDVIGHDLSLTIESDKVTAIGGKIIGVGAEMTSEEVIDIVNLCNDA